MANSYALFAVELKGLTKKEMLWARKEYSKRREKETGEEGGGDFDVTFYDKEGSVVLYSEESGTIDHAILFIQSFLKKFRPQQFIKMEWAFTCSKPRPGEFGGGAAVIGAEKLVVMTTDAWAESQLEILKHGG